MKKIYHYYQSSSMNIFAPEPLASGIFFHFSEMQNEALIQYREGLNG